MEYVFFSKMLQEQSIEQLIESLHFMGVDGVDLCVREGYPVNPNNVKDALLPAVQQIQKAGLSVPMVTTPGDFTDPSAPFVDTLFAACREADIRLIKLGYWHYGDNNYWNRVEQVRKDVEGFQKVAEHRGVKACLHTHSGNCMGLNASAMMHLVRGFDPACIGVYLDPGHLALCGEPLPMAFDMVWEYLAILGIKDSLWVHNESNRPRHALFLPVGEGFVNWQEMMRILIGRSFEGVLSIHSEFEFSSIEHLLKQTKLDTSLLRRLEQEARDSK